MSETHHSRRAPNTEVSESAPAQRSRLGRLPVDETSHRPPSWMILIKRPRDLRPQIPNLRQDRNMQAQRLARSSQVKIIDTAKSAGAAVVWERERAGVRASKLDSGERFPPRKEEESWESID